MSMQETSHSSASLYVGDLAPDVTEALLFEIFNAVGPVASVRVCRDAATRRSLGYAYVNFHHMDDAERALDTMNFKDIRNRPCRIMWSHRDPSLRKSGVGNIFVKHLPDNIDNKTLYDTFSLFGNILSCKVALNSQGKSLGYGFVHYESGEAAQNAIDRVDGKLIGGQKVSVAAFKSKSERGGGNSASFTNVYVKNLPEDYTEDKLKELFAEYGNVTSQKLILKDDGTARGFAFCNFMTHEEAKAAIEGLNGKDMGNEKTLFVARAQKKEEREKELRTRFEQLKLERQKKFAGVNLYVKNLHDSIDDAKLRAAFQEHGSITSARVMVDPQTGKTRGFGFVCYTTQEEATKAVTEMNTTMLEGKPLYVAIAQRKDVRRAQLEAQHNQRAKYGGVNHPQMFPGPAGGPMFYPPVPGMQQRIVYPQHMMRQGGYNRPGPQGMPMGQRPGSAGYQLLPAPGRQGQQPRQGGAPRGGRNQRNPKQMQGQQRRQQPQQAGQNFKYTDNVVNNQARAMQQPLQQQPAAAAQVPGEAQEPLTIKELAAADPAEQKQKIGDRLYPLVLAAEPEKAAKITGMLLEMDNAELIHLLEDAGALNDKIGEANKVLMESEGN